MLLLYKERVIMSKLKGFDDELRNKLDSGRYNFSKIISDTGISRYWLNNIKNNVCAPEYILVALREYFKAES